MSKILDLLQIEPLARGGQHTTAKVEVIWNARRIQVHSVDSEDLLFKEGSISGVQLSRSWHLSPRPWWRLWGLDSEHWFHVQLSTRSKRVIFSAKVLDPERLEGLPWLERTGIEVPIEALIEILQSARLMSARVVEWSKKDMETAPLRPSSVRSVEVRGGFLDRSPEIRGKRRVFQSLHEAILESEEGETLWLGNGRYHLSKPLLVQKSLTLIGEGALRSRIYGEASPFVIRFEGDGIFTMKGISVICSGRVSADVLQVRGGEILLEHCSFLGGSVSSRGDGGSGIRLQGHTKGTIKACQSIDNEGDGISIEDRSCVEVLRTRCTQNARHGIFSRHIARGEWRGNLCQKNGKDGIHITDISRPFLADNQGSYNRGHGLYLDSNEHLKIENQSCMDNDGDGIHVSGSAWLKLLKPEISGNKGEGVAFYKESCGAIEAGTLQRNEGHGLLLGGRGRIELRDCKFFLHGGHGLVIKDNAKAMIERCYFQKNKTGVYLKDHAEVVLQGILCSANRHHGLLSETEGMLSCTSSEFLNNRKNGALLRGCPRVSFSKGQFSGNQKDGLRLIDVVVNIQKNEFKNQTAINTAGLRVEGSSKGRIFENKCFQNFHGFIVGGTSHVQIDHNIMLRNLAFGVLITADAAPEITHNTLEGNHSAGACFRETSRGLFKENHCLKNHEAGISLEHSSHPRIEKNQIHENRGSGIVLCAHATSEIRNNIIYANQIHGVLVSENAAPLIEKNEIEAQRANGVHFKDCAGGSAQENNIFGNHGDGIFISSSESLKFLKNLSNKNRGHGIQATGKATFSIAGGCCDVNRGAGLFLSGESQGMIQDLQTQENSVGVLLEGFASCNIERLTSTLNRKEGLYLTESADVILLESKLQENKGDGLLAKDESKLKIRSSLLGMNLSNGIQLEGRAYATISSSEFMKNQGDGIRVTERCQVWISKTKSYKNNQSGILISGTVQATVRENIILNNSRGGILGGSSDPCHFENNHIEGNLGVGLQASSQAQVRRNTIFNNQYAGILVRGFEGVFEQNICNNNQQGILVTLDAKPLLINNFCSKNREIGIDFSDRSSGSAEKNRCYENNIAALRCRDSSFPYLKENHLEKSFGVGLLISSSDSPPIIAEQNSITENQKGGVVLSKNSHSTLRKNNIYANQGVGILAINKAKGELFENQIEGNKICALRLQNHACLKVSALSHFLGEILVEEQANVEIVEIELPREK